MTKQNNFSIKAKNFKSFGEKEQGFEDIKRLNVIIGKNNSGKSALLNLVRYFTEAYDLTSFHHKGTPSELIFTKHLTEDEIRRIFSNNQSGGVITGSHLDYGLGWVDQPITIKIIQGQDKIFISISPELPEEVIKTYGKQFANLTIPPFTGKTYIGISAERDIIPEPSNPIQDTTITPFPKIENGTGATNIIHNFLNVAPYDPLLVERNLLNCLNEICNPDINFTRIKTRQLGSGNVWEIFLEEDNKGFVPLSKSGSGLKTIILILISTILIPKVHGKQFDDYVFAFEEIENNLHPGILRGLLTYISKFATNNNCYFFLTTHSNVVIDFFSKNEDAQIIHTSHDGKTATVKTLATLSNKRSVLDDLGFKASDLLQTNGIIWVEGPTDRLYLLKWLEFYQSFNNLDEFIEGRHFSILFYGGSILSSFSLAEDEKVTEPNTTQLEDFIYLLSINRNAVVIMDRDYEEGKKWETKQRITKDVETYQQGFAWVTDGKEIESYLSERNISKSFPGKLLQAYTVNKKDYPFGDFFRTNDENKAKEKPKKFYENDKLDFAKKIIEHMEPTDLKDNQLLLEKITNVYDKIKSWNK